MTFKTTPKNVTKLSKCEIFVFGSNILGEHTGGASLTAYKKFGAEWGIGFGPTGQCYAIPTMQGDIESIRPYVDKFIEYAKTHPNNRFLVTRLGCGYAGFSDDEMAPLFTDAFDLPNVHLPEKWRNIIFAPRFMDALFGSVSVNKSVEIPPVITEQDLIRLCDEYKYIIGAGIKTVSKPHIRIRYVIDNNRFGYANFGDFFFFGDDDLYVWTRKKEFEEYHNQDVVEGYFNDECTGRGFCHRVIFAGVKTPYYDSKGEPIFTGDVLKILTIGFDGKKDVSDKEFEDRSEILAFGTLGENTKDSSAAYCFPLDNHCITPEMVARWERIGTVFYQLDHNEKLIPITERCFEFQDIYHMGLDKEKKRIMARYTPNSDKEVWKYLALELIGCEEYKWRK